MNHRIPVAAFAVAAATFVTGLVMSSGDLLAASLIPAGIGLGTSLALWRSRLHGERAEQQQAQLEEVESRLRLTEDQLAAAARELEAARELREFDMQLRSSTPKTP